MKRVDNQQKTIVVVGGGAAGFFAALQAASKDPYSRIILLEKSNHPLAKVRVSGGGRCNVTHACFEPKKLVQFYPRGGQALLGPFTRFGPKETVEWFAQRAITLKTEPDGRMFPITDNSSTIIDCLMKNAREAGIILHIGCGLEEMSVCEDGRFLMTLTAGETLVADRVILATGGNPGAKSWFIVRQLGHTIVPLVPSLFTFHIDDPRLQHLQGLSVPEVQLTLPGQKLSSKGPLLITHWGLSGPATLRLSAFGARAMHAVNYQCDLHIQWLPAFTLERLLAHFQDYKVKYGRRHVFLHPVGDLPTRLWERLAQQCGISYETKWSDLKKDVMMAFTQELVGQGKPYKITAKSTFKEEFVTAGGVELSEVDFRTMQSKKIPGLFFAGEILDIDGVTGGFNFQAAWTTGFTAGTGTALL